MVNVFNLVDAPMCQVVAVNGTLPIEVPAANSQEIRDQIPLPFSLYQTFTDFSPNWASVGNNVVKDAGFRFAVPFLASAALAWAVVAGVKSHRQEDTVSPYAENSISVANEWLNSVKTVIDDLKQLVQEVVKKSNGSTLKSNEASNTVKSLEISALREALAQTLIRNKQLMDTLRERKAELAKIESMNNEDLEAKRQHMRGIIRLDEKINRIRQAIFRMMRAHERCEKRLQRWINAVAQSTPPQVISEIKRHKRLKINGTGEEFTAGRIGSCGNPEMVANTCPAAGPNDFATWRLLYDLDDGVDDEAAVDADEDENLELDFLEEEEKDFCRFPDDPSQGTLTHRLFKLTEKIKRLLPDRVHRCVDLRLAALGKDGYGGSIDEAEEKQAWKQRKICEDDTTAPYNVWRRVDAQFGTAPRDCGFSSWSRNKRGSPFQMVCSFCNKQVNMARRELPWKYQTGTAAQQRAEKLSKVFSSLVSESQQRAKISTDSVVSDDVAESDAQSKLVANQFHLPGPYLQCASRMNLAPCRVHGRRRIDVSKPDSSNLRKPHMKKGAGGTSRRARSSSGRLTHHGSGFARSAAVQTSTDVIDEDDEVSGFIIYDGKRRRHATCLHLEICEESSSADSEQGSRRSPMQEASTGDPEESNGRLPSSEDDPGTDSFSTSVTSPQPSRMSSDSALGSSLRREEVNVGSPERSSKSVTSENLPEEDQEVLEGTKDPPDRNPAESKDELQDTHPGATVNSTNLLEILSNNTMAAADEENEASCQNIRSNIKEFSICLNNALAINVLCLCKAVAALERRKELASMSTDNAPLVEDPEMTALKDLIEQLQEERAALLPIMDRLQFLAASTSLVCERHPTSCPEGSAARTQHLKFDEALALGAASSLARGMVTVEDDNQESSSSFNTADSCSSPRTFHPEKTRIPVQD